MYVADTYNRIIRKITPQGGVTTLAGSAHERGGTDGQGANARFEKPEGIAVDRQQCVYVADAGNHTIRKISPDAKVTTIAGSAGRAGHADGPGMEARFNEPVGVAVDDMGNVYVADTRNHIVRKISSVGVVTTVAGSAGNDGNADGPATVARFRGPTGVAVDHAGNIHIADSGNARICTIDPAGQVHTRASRLGDLSRLIEPCGITLDDTGTIYVTDDDLIRKLTPTNQVVTVAGYSKPNRPEFPPRPMMNNDYLLKYEDGPCKLARFSMPQAIAVGSDGSLYVADTGNNTIRRIFPDDGGHKQH